MSSTINQLAPDDYDRCTGDTDTCPDRECLACGERDCLYREPLHYSHDGCPRCQEPDTPVTDAPYSAQWREHARARLFRLGVSVESVATRTGLGGLAREALLGSGPVSLEVCGPVDELLEQLEAGCGRRTARRMRPASVEVGPVLADLGPLTDCDVALEVKP